MRILIYFFNLLTLVTSISWYKNFGKSIDNAECVEETQPIVEYYKIDDYQYMFFSELVSWDEANTICRIYDGQLAIVNTATKANKLAATMAQSNIDMEDIWIGGQRSDKGHWSWVNEEPIPLEPTDGFPPWVRTPDRPWKQCVAMDRYTFDVPLFVDLDCRLPKPFICQRDFDAPANPDVTLPSHTVKAGKSTFILYHSRISWGTAAAFCRMRGYRLAIIPNNKVAKIVGSAMIRSRPSFENMWISGHFIHKKWRWLSTGEAMQSYPNENNYPPWHHNSTNLTSGCLLLDLHLCDNPVFLTVRCDRKRDFICEKYEKNIKHKAKPGPIKISYKNWTMTLHLKDLNWYDAQKYCHDENGYLTEVFDYGMMKTITTVMSDQESEPVHVWLGGKFINNKWIWVESNKTIPLTKNEGGFMDWCGIEDKNDNACLNMDREAHDRPEVYGLKCKLKQPFVCTKYKGKAKYTTILSTRKSPTTQITTKISRTISTTTKARTTRKVSKTTTRRTTTTPTTTTTTRTTTTPTTTTSTTTTPTTTTPTTTTPTTTTPTTTTPTTTTSTTTTPTTTTPTTTTTTRTTTPTTTTRTTTTPTTTTRTTTTPTTTTSSTTTRTTTTRTTTTTTLTTTTPTTTTPTTAIPTTTTSKTISTRTTVKMSTTMRVRPKFIECDQAPVVTEIRKDKLYVSFFSPVPYAEANTSCIKSGGYLSKLLGKEKRKLSKSLNASTNSCAQRHLDHIWITTTKLGGCTYLNYPNNTALLSATCREDVKGYVCEINCEKDTLNHSMFSYNIWNCSMDGNTKICTVSCKQGSVLEGVHTLQCSTIGWVDIYKKTTQLPICQREDKVTLDLMNWIKQFHGKQYRILYVMNDATTTEQWRQQLYFIVGLIQVFPLSDLSPFGLIIYHKNAKVVVPFNATDTCEVLEALHKLRPDPNSQMSFYKPALELAAKQIETLQMNEKTLIMFFATTPNTGDKYEDILNKIKEKHKILTIAINKDPKEDLLSLGSTINDTFLSFKFNDFQSFAKVALSFTNHRSKELDCPERLYTLPKDTLCHQDSISVYNDGITYTALFNKKTYETAKIKCLDAGGKLANFKGRKLKGVVNNIMKEAKSCAALELWIHSEQAPCASVAISHNRDNSGVLNCSLQFGEICEISCGEATYPQHPKYENNIWNCTKSAGISKCYVECKGDSVMRGSDSVVCTNKGWVVDTNKQITYFPTCFDSNVVLQKLLTVTRDLIKETDGFLFLIDISGLASNPSWKPLQFVTSIINAFPISSQHPLGIILFHKKAEVLIPYKATNTCKVLKQIQELNLQGPAMNDGYSAYESALKEAHSQILTWHHRRQTIIFFITDRNNKGESYEEIANELRKRHIIFGVGINKHSMRDLDSIASMYNDKLLMYKFNHHNSYNEVLKKLQSKSSRTKC